MHPQNANGRATWTRPRFGSHYDGAPGTAQHVNSITLKSDAMYSVPAFSGHFKAGVASLHTGARDAHVTPYTPH
jgi:hypothetical protein